MFSSAKTKKSVSIVHYYFFCLLACNVHGKMITSSWDGTLFCKIWQPTIFYSTTLWLLHQCSLNWEIFPAWVQPDQLERCKKTDCFAVPISYINSLEADRLLWEKLKCYDSGEPGLELLLPGTEQSMHYAHECFSVLSGTAN